MLSKSYTIVTTLSDLQFPLREATRKQVWWLALKLKNEYQQVKILLLSNEYAGNITKSNGIEIQTISYHQLPLFKFGTGPIHFVNGCISNKLIISYIRLFFLKNVRLLTLTDGDIYGDGIKAIKKAMPKVLSLIFQRIFVFSLYQKKQFGVSSVCVIRPIMPIINMDHKKNKNLHPTLLYMGHLSRYKGVQLIIDAFEICISTFPTLELVIANNMVEGEREIVHAVQRLKDKYPNNVTLKGVVNPIEEISSAWVLLYPFSVPKGTMAFPLTYYESIICGTPFIGCSIGAIPEYFDKKYLIEPNNIDQLVKKIKLFITLYSDNI
jgi:glycosyltransferase involved in cell wall biosynthesis